MCNIHSSSSLLKYGEFSNDGIEYKKIRELIGRSEYRIFEDEDSDQIVKLQFVKRTPSMKMQNLSLFSKVEDYNRPPSVFMKVQKEDHFILESAVQTKSSFDGDKSVLESFIAENQNVIDCEFDD